MGFSPSEKSKILKDVSNLKDVTADINQRLDDAVMALSKSVNDLRDAVDGILKDQMDEKIKKAAAERQITINETFKEE